MTDRLVKQRNSPAGAEGAKPILRWAGSKRLLLPKLLSLAPREYRRYIEPFCGSACLFLALNPPKSILADVNPHLISTYEQVKLRPIDVAEVMASWSATRKEYLRVRGASMTTAVEKAGRFLYLNRYSFNGVYRENLKGQFNVPFGGARKNGQLASVTELIAFSRALAHTRLVCSDFEDIIAQAKAGDFLYLDPPYHYGTARNRGEYGYGAFSSADVDRFVSSVAAANKRGAQILISYNRAHQLKKALKGWSLAHCSTRRSIAGFTQSRRVVREYLLRNY
jgi:DNA adenine methylase